MNFKNILCLFSITVVCSASAMDRQPYKPLLTEKQLSALTNPNYYFCDQKKYKNATCLICKSHEQLIDTPQNDKEIVWITTPCCQ